jgi:20S proteasome alpha/beta subunit
MSCARSPYSCPFPCAAKNGVVIATEKKLASILVDGDAFQKIETVHTGCGMVYAGMQADFRVLVKKARKDAQSYFRVYQEHQPTGQSVKGVANVMQEFTQVRGPFLRDATCNLQRLTAEPATTVWWR